LGNNAQLALQAGVPRRQVTQETGPEARPPARSGPMPRRERKKNHPAPALRSLLSSELLS
ncbi:MAG: hypothetical protein J7M32_04625, partial [Deltaproteobacteria bacterium]|nr:hypothetical protein [Deltaproteobacteria bacterium]